MRSGLYSGHSVLASGIHQSDITPRVGLTFAVLAYWSFGSLTALPLTIFERPVFYMQRDQKYYRTSPYLFSTVVAEVTSSSLVSGHQEANHTNWVRNVVHSDSDDDGRSGSLLVDPLLAGQLERRRQRRTVRILRLHELPLLLGTLPASVGERVSPLPANVRSSAIASFQTMRSFTRMVAVWSPSLLYAQSLAPTFVAMLLMFGGFLVPRVR